jgi:hypothetical protein
MMWTPLVHARGSIYRVDLEGFFFCYLTSLAYGDVMSRLGSIVVVIGCCDVIVVSRFVGAPPSGRFVPVVCPCPVNVLTC